MLYRRGFMKRGKIKRWEEQEIQREPESDMEVATENINAEAELVYSIPINISTHFIKDKNKGSITKEDSEMDSSASEAGRPPLIVRNEEIVIVSVVLFIWISVILIFINRWGRIRMLEPYLPDYKSPSIPSISPMLPKRASRISINVDPPSTSNLSGNRQLADINLDKQMFSSQMYLNRMCGNGSGNSGAGTSVIGSTGVSSIPMRPRGNSVITGSTACMLAVEGFNNCRKTRSVENLHRSMAVKTSRSTDI